MSPSEQKPFVVGMKGWLSDALERQLEPLERRSRVRRLGYVAHEDLPFVYAGAHAFAFPSYEVFRARAVRAGPQRAAGFTWGRCVDRTVDVYRRVLAGTI